MVFWVLALTAEPVEPGDQFTQANAAYDAGNYPDAIVAYEALLTAGVDSGWVYYNLANAYLRDAQLGHAVAAYRRAEVRLPRNGDVQANLHFARQQTTDALAPAQAAPLLRNLIFWHYALSYHELTYVTAMVNGLFWLCMILLLWQRETTVLRWSGALLAIMWAATGLSLLVRSAFNSEVAVVLKPEVQVHSGTNYDTVVRFKLHEGTESYVMDSEEGWLRIELSDGKQGWVAATDVVRVAL